MALLDHDLLGCEATLQGPTPVPTPTLAGSQVAVR